MEEPPQRGRRPFGSFVLTDELRGILLGRYCRESSPNTKQRLRSESGSIPSSIIHPSSSVIHHPPAHDRCDERRPNEKTIKYFTKIEKCTGKKLGHEEKALFVQKNHELRHDLHLSRYAGSRFARRQRFHRAYL